MTNASVRTKWALPLVPAAHSSPPAAPTQTVSGSEKFPARQKGLTCAFVTSGVKPLRLQNRYVQLGSHGEHQHIGNSTQTVCGSAYPTPSMDLQLRHKHTERFVIRCPSPPFKSCDRDNALIPFTSPPLIFWHKKVLKNRKICKTRRAERRHVAFKKPANIILHIGPKT